MEKHSPVIDVQPAPIPSHIDILTDALAKCKERFDRAVQENNSDRLYDIVSQMTQISHSITEAVKAERETTLEADVRELGEIVNEMADDLEDLYMDRVEDSFGLKQ